MTLTDVKKEIEQRFVVLSEAEKERQNSNHNRITYCAKCNEFSLEYPKDDDWHELGCVDEHFEYIMVSDYEETSFHGFVKGLEVALEEINNQ